MKYLPNIMGMLPSFIPEGRIKNELRRVFYNMKLGGEGTVSYSRHGIILKFNIGQLKGEKVLFPFDKKTLNSVIMYSFADVPIYFSCFYIAEGSTFVDGGGFPGDTTVAAAKKVGRNGRVFAFEPDPLSRYYLEKTIKVNGVHGWTKVFPYALAGSCGNAFFQKNNRGSGSITSALTDNTVETVTLDAILEEEGVFKYEEDIFVKLDIEGGELGALEGGSKTLDHGVRFAIAAYHEVNGQPTWIALKKIFEEKGYATIIRAPHKHLTLFAEPKTRIQRMQKMGITP